MIDPLPKPASPGEWSVLGCLGIAVFLGSGLFCLGAVVVGRVAGHPLENESQVHSAGLLGVGLGIAIPVVTRLVRNHFE